MASYQIYNINKNIEIIKTNPNSEVEKDKWKKPIRVIHSRFQLAK